jgi:hypothetical protein
MTVTLISSIPYSNKKRFDGCRSFQVRKLHPLALRLEQTGIRQSAAEDLDFGLLPDRASMVLFVGHPRRTGQPAIAGWSSYHLRKSAPFT